MVKASKMGRPKQTDSQRQQKVETIIEAAQDLFASEGYQSVSMRKISERAGMGTMTLYKYFPSKTAILHHIWGVFFDELFELIKTEIEQAKEVKDKIRKVCITYIGYWVEHKERFHIVFLNEDRAESSDEFFINHANIFGKFLQIVGPLMMQVDGKVDSGKVDSGKVDSDKLLMLLESAICYVHGIALNVITISEYPWNDYEKYIDVFLDAVWPTI